MINISVQVYEIKVALKKIEVAALGTDSESHIQQCVDDVNENLDMIITGFESLDYMNIDINETNLMLYKAFQRACELLEEFSDQSAEEIEWELLNKEY